MPRQRARSSRGRMYPPNPTMFSGGLTAPPPNPPGPVYEGFMPIVPERRRDLVYNFLRVHNYVKGSLCHRIDS